MFNANVGASLLNLPDHQNLLSNVDTSLGNKQNSETLLNPPPRQNKPRQKTRGVSAATKKRRPVLSTPTEESTATLEPPTTAQLPFNRLLPMAIVRQPQALNLDYLLGGPPAFRASPSAVRLPPAADDSTTPVSNQLKKIWNIQRKFFPWNTRVRNNCWHSFLYSCIIMVEFIIINMQL